MSSHQSRVERQFAAVALIVFAFLQFGMVLLELILAKALPLTLAADFLEKAKVSSVVFYFLVYLVTGAAGFVGVLGLVQVYQQSRRLVGEVARLSALGYFLSAYWLWSATWIVQYKVTLLTDKPTDPPDWLLRIFAASDALWSLPSWGGIGPSILLFACLGWLLWRGSRRLPKAASVLFYALAVSRFADIVYIGASGATVANVAGYDFAFYNDVFFAGGRILAFVFAGAALYTEKGVFVRTHRAGRT